MKIKLCGFSEENSLQEAIRQKCDFLGFIFYDKSPRNISLKKARELFDIVPQTIAKVAVVVDPNPEFLSQIINLKPQYVQFHGSESPKFLQEFRLKNPQIKIIKAFRISSALDLEQIKDYEDSSDLFLFDAKISGQQGGTGHKFDWQILQNLKTTKGWFLSGGINIDNISDAINNSGAQMFDISSGIEEQKGLKSKEKIAQIMNFFHLNPKN